MKTVLRLLPCGVMFIAACSSRTTAQLPRSALTPVEMRPGIVVDRGRRVAYVMNVDRGITAIELGRGVELWTSRSAAKPLALVGDILVAQVEPTDTANRLRVAALIVRARGERVWTNAVRLPDTVKVTIDNTLNTSFTTSARVVGEVVLVLWEYKETVIGGVPPDNPALGARSPTPVRLSGGFRINPLTGAVTDATSDVHVDLGPRAPAAPPNERIPRAAGAQFFSADSSHVMISQLAAPDTVWDKYRWMIYDRRTRQRVGQLRTHLSWAPFVVMGPNFTYETGPYVRRIGGKLVEEPRKIRGVELATGQERWSRQVRDTEYRGPYPP